MTEFSDELSMLQYPQSQNMRTTPKVHLNLLQFNSLININKKCLPQVSFCPVAALQLALNILSIQQGLCARSTSLLMPLNKTYQ